LPRPKILIRSTRPRGTRHHSRIALARPRNSVHLTLRSYASSPPVCLLPYYPFSHPHRRQTSSTISSLRIRLVRCHQESAKLSARIVARVSERGCAWRLRRVRAATACAYFICEGSPTRIHSTTKLEDISLTPDGRYHIHITFAMEDRSDARGRTLDDEFDFNAGDLSKQFEQLLRTRRLNELEERARSPRPSSPASFQRRASGHSPSPYPRSPATPQSASHFSPRPSQHQPPAYQTFRSLPIVPSMPTDTASHKFRNLLVTLSHTPIKYENPGLLDEALTYVPIDRLYAEAEEEHNIMKGLAASMGDNEKPEWGYQDCVIRALLR
jgi:hypothetical protein